MFPSSIFTTALNSIGRIDWRDVLRFLSMILLIVGVILFAIGAGVLLVWFVTNPMVHAGIRLALSGAIIFVLGLIALKVANG